MGGGITRATAWEVTIAQIARTDDGGTRTSQRKPVSTPLLAAAWIVEDVLQTALMLEPRRGPGAQISLSIVARGDDGTCVVQEFEKFSPEVFNRNVDRPFYVEFLVVLRRKRVNQLGAIVQHPAQGGDVHTWRHRHRVRTSASSSNSSFGITCSR